MSWWTSCDSSVVDEADAVMQQFRTRDTSEDIRAPALPRGGTEELGHDWVQGLTDTPWKVISSWGEEGWEAGAWPYAILVAASHQDAKGPLYGYGTFLEGDTYAHWFRNRQACHDAITDDVFWYWKLGYSDGPFPLPPSAEDLGKEIRKPFGRIHRAPY